MISQTQAIILTKTLEVMALQSENNVSPLVKSGTMTARIIRMNGMFMYEFSGILRPVYVDHQLFVSMLSEGVSDDFYQKFEEGNEKMVAFVSKFINNLFEKV